MCASWPKQNKAKIKNMFKILTVVLQNAKYFTNIMESVWQETVIKYNRETSGILLLKNPKP